MGCLGSFESLSQMGRGIILSIPGENLISYIHFGSFNTEDIIV